MREIFFRGKRTDNGEWVQGNLLLDKDLEQAQIVWFDYKSTEDGVERYGDGAIVIPETVGQFTGLYDRNGVKIFEGDILSAHLDEDNPDYETVVQVIWEEYGWRTMEENGLSDPLDDEDAEIFAIIGNIHDNPELLKGGEGNG